MRGFISYRRNFESFWSNLQADCFGISFAEKRNPLRERERERERV
jgi:hypothetical protein